MRCTMLTVSAGLAILPAATVLAQPHTLTLTSGETMNVVVLERTSESVRVEHPVLGELSIPAGGVTSIDGEAYEPVLEQIAAQPEEAEAAEAAASPWTTSIELGVSGSEGNTENANVRASLRTERLVEGVERFSFLTRYKLETDQGDRTENEWYTLALQEWYMPDAPRWSWFVQGDAEYDEFQDWDLRVSGTVGIGYIIIDEEKTKLRGRVGVGGSYEFGATDEEFVPEALLGYDFEHQINDRSRFTSVGNLYPSLSNGGEFRSYFDAAYEIDMTDAGDWTLRLGVDHQYDSDSDARPWDFSYYAAVVLSF